MSSTMDSEGPAGGDGTVRHAFKMWAGHHERMILIVGSVSAIAIAAAADVVNLPGWHGDVLTLTALTGILLAILSSTFVPYHDSHVCVRHMLEAPLDDPAGAASRRDRQLRTYHQPIGRGVRLAPPAGFMAFVVADVVLHLPHLIAMLPFDVLVAVFAYRAWCGVVHRKLQPWCKYCRRRGDDDGFAPTGPTSPTTSQKVTLR